MQRGILCRNKRTLRQSTVLWGNSLRRPSKERKLCISMVRPSNAYGSICSPQADRVGDGAVPYTIPGNLQQIGRSCLRGIQIRFTLDDYTTSWHRAENLIVTGCTMSPILFVLGNGNQNCTERPQTKDVLNYQPPIKGSWRISRAQQRSIYRQNAPY